MTDPIPFLAPHLVGGRFADHTIPLEVLRDFAVLEELVVEVAKWHYFNQHPGRKRSPRGFTECVSLKLTAIDDGSAIAKIGLSLSLAAGLFPSENQICFEEARDSIVAAINAAQHDEPISNHLTDSHLAYFDRIGRSLRDGEAIEFDYTNQNRPARLDKDTRRKLTLASSEIREFTEEIVLRGTIPEADQRKKRFELQLMDGQRVFAPWDSHHFEPVMEAFNGYRDDVRVSLQGIARFNRSERMQSIESVEHITILDSMDIAARLDEFHLLRDGWLDGKGIAPASDDLVWLTDRFETFYPDDLPFPFLYPTAEGGIQAEWSLGKNEISLEVSFDGRRGEWHSLDVETQAESTRNLNLEEQADWQWVVQQIRDVAGDAH